MRLWHYKLIPVLPKQMLVSQWREVVAIKRQWEKGTLIHRLVSYVKNYDKEYFADYVTSLVIELEIRNIKIQEKYFNEILDFCHIKIVNNVYEEVLRYTEHNDRYLKQCLYNLQEKFDRGIITQEEWSKIVDKFGGYL